MDKINSSTILSSISCGFPSSIDDFSELSISLDKYLIQNPESTFMAYANGNSMNNVGIYNGDIMIVDKSLIPQTKDIVVAVIDGEFTVKRMYKKNNKIYLAPSNKNYKSVCITDDMDFQVWGVVTHTIHHCR